MSADLEANQPVPLEGYVPVGNAELYYREVGQGQPIIVLHGGPDFDHSYLLPEMDRLFDAFRLIYYDQRGRGKSGRNVVPEDVSMRSEMEDLEEIRKYFGLETTAVLGHSWGGILAMEYAVRHPTRVSHLILMDSAPASHDDYMRFREERRKNRPADVEKLKELASTARYQEGDLEADADYYRVHFRATVRQPQQLEKVVKSLRANVNKEGILRARAIEDRLYDETWLVNKYDLLPRLRRLSIPSLVIHGDNDLVPIMCAAHIAEAISGARFALLRGGGHFSYLECPDEVRKEIVDFFQGA
ncbi:MAG: alpha/beta fold hydrolase [Chloroflexia bacterium]